MEIARRYDEEKADEIVFLDIRASTDNRDTMVDVVRRTAEQVFMPLCVGGGIRNMDDIRRMLNAGADRVSVNTPAIENPDFINASSARFGAQCIVVAIDAMKYQPGEGEGYYVKSHGGRDGGRATRLEPVAWLKKPRPAARAKSCSPPWIATAPRTGMTSNSTRAVADAVGIPVIASGGAGTLEHLRAALQEGGADAALAASILHYQEHTILEAKRYLADKGVPVRC